MAFTFIGDMTQKSNTKPCDRNSEHLPIVLRALAKAHNCIGMVKSHLKHQGEKKKRKQKNDRHP